MSERYYCAFRVQGVFFDRDVRVSAKRDHVQLAAETVLPEGDDRRSFTFDMRPGDAGVLAMKLLEAMSAVNRERATRLVRETLQRMERQG